jgi:hypothetical protein
MNKLLVAPLALTLPLVFIAGCEERECESFNGCGPNAFCSADGFCVDEAPPRFDDAWGPNWEGEVELASANLAGEFGPVHVGDEPATMAFAWQDRTNATLYVDVYDEGAGRWAMLALSVPPPLSEALPCPGEPPIVIDTAAPQTEATVCSSSAETAEYDVAADEVTISAQEAEPGVVFYELHMKTRADDGEPADAYARFRLPIPSPSGGVTNQDFYD